MEPTQVYPEPTGGELPVKEILGALGAGSAAIEPLTAEGPPSEQRNIRQQSRRPAVGGGAPIGAGPPMGPEQLTTILRALLFGESQRNAPRPGASGRAPFT